MALPEDPAAFDAYHPSHVSPLVAWLASTSCPLTGKVFSVRGGQINELIPWTTGQDLTTNGPWTFDKLDQALNGSSPATS